MDDRFYQGIEEFNAGRYFEAHEVLEDLWHEYRETDRTFIQGLIQISAGFYHFQCANWKGAKSQLSKGTKKLAAFRPQHLDLDVEKLVSQTTIWCEKLGKYEDGGTLDRKSLAFPQLRIGRERARAHA
ncbi:MAG: DUF309 domain-containing protein [Ignavibacteriales bacterium]|nr:DUF309 domain-containing protein [Ignavibacteriales bacterium]